MEYRNIHHMQLGIGRYTLTEGATLSDERLTDREKQTIALFVEKKFLQPVKFEEPAAGEPDPPAPITIEEESDAPQEDRESEKPSRNRNRNKKTE